MTHTDDEKALIQLLLPFSNRHPNACVTEAEALHQYVHDMGIRKGWKRGQIYRFLVNVADNYRDKLSAESFDAIDNYITTVTGDCCPECFARFPDEPEDPNEFVRYVREHKWMEDGP